MPRFVLLYHDCPPSGGLASHWDFMLEVGDVLRTWRLEQLPAQWKTAHQRTAAKYRDCAAIATDASVAATQLGDHRLAYLDYEGEVSDGRGRVIRVAAGVYDLEIESALRIKYTLDGNSIVGHVVLERATAIAEMWTLSASNSS
jgi:hypothetical protein